MLLENNPKKRIEHGSGLDVGLMPCVPRSGTWKHGDVKP
jgi:hypothetical protein